ncbi:MAG: hypothetical protein AAB489_00875 [Patescibacteria group bacterium]
MEQELAHTIVEDVVTTEQENGQEVTVDQFTTNVEVEVEERVEVFQEQFGDAVNGLAGQVMTDTKSYAESKKAILDGSAFVGDAAAIGAAAYTNMGDRSVTYDVNAMDYALQDEGYWKRVHEHERIHQEDQAGAYNLQSITYVDTSGNVVTTKVGALVEWQPSSQANIPSDLTTEYQQHVKDGGELAAVVGESRIEQALKDGDMQGMQREIVEEQLPEFMEVAGITNESGVGEKQ